MSDEEFFFLLDQAQLATNIFYTDDPVVGGSKPISTLTGVEVPEDTPQLRNLKLYDRSQETLKYNGTLVISLKLYNFLYGLYRANIEQQEKNIVDIQKSPEETENNLEIFLHSLPPHAKSLGSSFYSVSLKNYTAGEIENNGFVKYPGI